MESEVNSFVKNANILGVVRSDVAILKYSLNSNQNDVVQIERIEQLISDANRNLVGALSHEFDMPLGEGFSISLISKRILDVVDLVKSFSNGDVLNFGELEDVLKSCASSFSEENFLKVVTAIKRNRSQFRKQEILLKDICVEFTY